MPNWKKVITSGSNALLNDITASGAVTSTTYYGDGSNLTNLPTQDPFPYIGSAVITGSNSLSGNYALKVANSSGTDLITAENDGKIYLRNASHTSGDINSTGSIVHYGDLTLGPVTSNAPDRKLTIAGYDGAQVEFNLHNGWGKPTIEAHYNGTIKYINYGNNSTNLAFQFGESVSRQGSMRFYTDSDEAIKFGTNAGYPLAYIGVVEQPNNYNGGLVIKSRNGTSIVNTWTFGRYGDLTTPGNINLSGSLIVSQSVTATTYYGDGSNLTGISSDPFPYTGSAIISGSLEVIGNISGSLTGSFSHLKATTIEGNSPLSVLGVSNLTFTSSGEGITFSNTNLYGNPIFHGDVNIYNQSQFLDESDNVIFESTNNGDPYNGEIRFGGISVPTRINGDGIILVSPVTASIISSSTYYGDGSNLTGISSDPFPYTGSAIISGSLEVTGSITVTSDITASGDLSINGFPSVSASLAAASGGGGSTYRTWISGKGQNTSQVTYGTAWRGSMSGHSQGAHYVPSADTSLITFTGTPSVGDTNSANNYKIITTILHPNQAFTNISWNGFLRAYNSACDGNTQNMEVWTLDDINDLDGYGTTTLTYRGGSSWTYATPNAFITPNVVSGSISYTGTSSTAFIVTSHVPTNPASSMQFVYNFDFTIT
jgi:hypothetical protein